MFSVYKGLLLFILIANSLAIPVFKRESADGKKYIFETIRTVLNCVCYYEEGETLTNDKVDKYCDCSPETVEQNKSFVKEDEIENKVNDAKYLRDGLDVQDDLNENHEVDVASKINALNFSDNDEAENPDIVVENAKYMVDSLDIQDEINENHEVDVASKINALNFSDEAENPDIVVDNAKYMVDSLDIQDEINENHEVDVASKINALNFSDEAENQEIVVDDGKYMVDSLDVQDENLGDVQKYGSADAAFFANVEENEAKQEEENIKDDIERQIMNAINAKHITNLGLGETEENLGDVQKYGSADAAFFANVEENEAKQEQENINDDMAIPLFNGDGKFIPRVDDGEDVDVNGMEGDVVEDVKEFNNVNGLIKNNESAINSKFALLSGLDIGISNDNDETDNNEAGNDEDVNDEAVYYDNNNDDFKYDAEFSNTKLVYNNLDLEEEIKAADEAAEEDNLDVNYDASFSNTRYVYQNLDNNDSADKNVEKDVIYDENGNEINLEIEMVGEAYDEVADDNELNDEDVPLRPTIKRGGKNILDAIDQPVVGADAKYIVDAYNNEGGFNDDDEVNEDINEDMELDLEEDIVTLNNVKAIKDSIEEDQIPEPVPEPSPESAQEPAQEPAPVEENANGDMINDKEELKSIYKQLIVEKLKEDIKKMDSEKLIVEILKEAFQGGSSVPLFLL
ncbi:hypothetical protein PIROE2DRAFT_3899 [Piromyces sp. E2]|nr:hypothetical protein PIROE2DRAFT_3899 [Piromyces sp. E2]|eukprot:OUM68441.1 hypothetical protein PIROE2DRAFT_3899 [Piromyces sp. E2]